MSWQVATPAADGLGESPFWHPHEQRLYWVDIPGRAVLRMRVEGTSCVGHSVERWVLDEEPGCIAPARNGGLVIAKRDGIFRAPQWGGELHCLWRATYDTATMRCNDGKCDALGRFWVGTMYEPRTQDSGSLWCWDAREGTPQMREVLRGAVVANGLAWSPDNRQLYWSCTGKHHVRRWDWDAQRNTISNEQLFYAASPKPAGWDASDAARAPYGGRPDGATVDAQGAYWSAQYEGQRLLQFSPEGQLLAEWPLPVMCPTMVCFGGEDLRTLFVTTSAQGRSATELEKYPSSGRVLARRMDTPGLPVCFYEGS